MSHRLVARAAHTTIPTLRQVEMLETLKALVAPIPFVSAVCLYTRSRVVKMYKCRPPTGGAQLTRK
jgi:hypothetical protein